MTDANTVWLVPPYGQGEPKEVEAKPAILVPLMVAGYSQCPPPHKKEEVKPDVDE